MATLISALAYVDVIDTLPPKMLAQNALVYLDSSGEVTISVATVDSATMDNCDIDSMWVIPNSFTCVDSNDNDVQLFARDISGNTDSITVNVEVLDTIAPYVEASGTTVYLDSLGVISIDTSDVNTLSWDNCMIDTMWLSQSSFSCADIGTMVIELFAQDISGNVNSDTTIITVIDSIAPHIISQNITVYLDSFGTYTIEQASPDSGSWDSCGIASYSVNDSIFGCSDIGTSTRIGFTVTDVNGNSSTDSIDVSVFDTIAPTIITQTVTALLDSTGNVSVTAAQFDNGTWDSCGVDTIYLSQYNFDCAQSGSNLINFYAEDVHGNIDSVVVQVDVLELVPPTVIPHDIVVALDSVGEALITAAMVDSASFDSCGIDTMWLDVYAFNCADTGANSVTLFVQDLSGNFDSATAEVYIEDTLAPIVYVINTTVYLDSFGAFTLTVSDIDSGSWDSCGIVNYALDTSNFSCASADSTINVTLTVTDVSGNMASAVAEVTVRDTIAPEILAQNITIYLDSNGQASIDPDTIDLGTWDSCGIASLTLDTSSFDCLSAGSPVEAIFTATDVNGNQDTAHVIITIVDSQPPVVVSNNLTVYLDSTGNAVVNSDSFDNGSSDNCDIQSIIASDTVFSCADAGDTINIVLTITDVNGNSDTSLIKAFVVDTLAPIAQTQDLTVYLDSAGLFTLTPSDIDSGSWDSCGIATYVLDTSAFDCDNANDTLPVTLTITDVNGNVATSTCNVTVLDTVSPVVWLNDLTVYLDSNGTVSIDANVIDSATTDACGIDTLLIDTSIFGCESAGQNIVVTLTAFDTKGNSAQGSSVVTVLDTLPPVIEAQSILVYLDSSGNAMVNSIDFDSSSSDNCEIASIVASDTTYNCADAGLSLPILLTITDVNGNSDTMTVYAEIEDTLAPIVITSDITVFLDSTGLASIDYTDINNGSWDSCGIASYLLDVDSFDCGDAGDTIPVTLTVTDVNGNSRSELALVEVLDTISPHVLTTNLIVALDSFGFASITTTQADSGSWDSCGIESRYLDIDTFSCGEIGSNTITLFVDDVHGNTGSNALIVTVIDTIAPKAITQDIEVYVDSTGNYFLDPLEVDNGSWDSCGIVSYALDDSTFTCSDTGTLSVLLTVTDIYGNADTASASVTLLDTLAPFMNAQDITIYLDSSGTS